MTGSYNETLSTVFSKGVRNAIQEEKADENFIIFRDIFPDIRIKQGDGSMNLWSLEGSYNNYLATSPTGTATGFGASILLLDDIIKNAYEGLNDKILEDHWEWFSNTMLSRLEEGGKIIIVMTRWNSNDLSGRCERYFKEAGRKVRKILYKAYENGKMLCPEILSEKSYKLKIQAMDARVAEANYNQTPIDIKGCLFNKELKVYTELPKNEDGDLIYDRFLCYTDTADTGEDNLVHATALIYQGDIYIIDLYISNEAMEITEGEVADNIYINKPDEAIMESNNGGRGYRRSVERILKEKYGYRHTIFIDEPQTKNKEARILSNSTYILNRVYMPVNWGTKYPDAYREIYSYSKDKKGQHDDTIDVLTKLAEIAQEENNFNVRFV